MGLSATHHQISSTWPIGVGAFMHQRGHIQITFTFTFNHIQKSDNAHPLQVGATVCTLLVLVAMTPCLVALWRNPSTSLLLHSTSYAALCGFMFGFHVHEKAILTSVILDAVQACRGHGGRLSFSVLAATASYSVHPLLYKQDEYAAKWAITLTYMSLLFALPTQEASRARLQGSAEASAETAQNSQGQQRKRLHGKHPAGKVRSAGSRRFVQWQWWYLCGFAALECSCAALHRVSWGEQNDFLPLALTSVYCAGGIGMLWAQQLWAFVTMLSCKKRS